MRIFYSFLILVCSSILIMLPVTEGVYAYRTDQREDTFSITTENITTADVVLLKTIYDDDTSTVLFASSIAEVPTVSSYNGTTRNLSIAALTENTTRSLDIQYDVSAISNSAVDSFMDIIPWIWILLWIAFPVAGLAAIWTGRA